MATKLYILVGVIFSLLFFYYLRTSLLRVEVGGGSRAVVKWPGEGNGGKVVAVTEEMGINV